MELNPATPETPPGASFRSLPVEIRNIIYGYCLLIDDSGHGSTKHAERCYIKENRIMHQVFGNTFAPGIGLCLVNKQISKEAVSFFYGNNVWWMTSWPYCRNNPHQQIWQRHAPTFRHVVVYCNKKDYCHTLYEYLHDHYFALASCMPFATVLLMKSQKACCSRKIALAMSLPNLQSFHVCINDMDSWGDYDQAYMLRYIVGMITIHMRAIRERESTSGRTWRIRFEGRNTEEERNILHQLDGLAPRLTWTLRKWDCFDWLPQA